MDDDDWRKWKNGKYDNRYHGVKRHAGQKNYKKIIIIVAILVAGFFFYQNMGWITNNVNHTQETLVKQIPNLTAQLPPPLRSIEPKIVSIIGNLSNSIPKTITPPQFPQIQPTITNPSSSVERKPIISISELEQKIHLLINVERQNNNVSPLALDPALSSITRTHSQDMATRNYFEHDTPEGQDPTARGLNAGYHCHKDLPNGYYTNGLAENIYQNNLYNSYETMNGIITSHDWNDMDALASSTVQGWMGSTGHRENILTPAYDREGIGVAIASDDKVYITEDFC